MCIRGRSDGSGNLVLIASRMSASLTRLVSLQVGVGHLQERRVVRRRPGVGLPAYQVADDMIRLGRGTALEIAEH